MLLFNFRDWKITTKIVSISAITILASILGGLFYIMPLMQSKLMEEKKTATRGIVEVAYSLIADYEARAQKGEFSMQEAQKRALESIKVLRYKGSEYVWINDMQPRMVMHPMKPEMDGQDLGDFKDPNGKALFVEMVKVCRDNGEGFVDYYWPKPGASQPVPKVSFVKLHKPWGWIVGSGIYVDDVVAEIGDMRRKVAISTVIESFFIFALVFAISLIITKPLRASVVLANRMAEGDFTVADLNIKSRDEAGTLAAALNRTKNELNRLLATAMGSVAGTASQVASAAEELSTSVHEMAGRIEEQSKRSMQVAAASTEMSQTVIDIAKNASGIAASATETLTVARNGEQVVNQTVGEVRVISGTMTESSQLVTALGERSRQIFAVVHVIKDIADQTNLLALNAAIEAARAGEQGRGFAVVADEVRKLAEKTSKATAEVGEMIGAIQDETEKVVAAMAESKARVEKGVLLSAEAGSALRNILESVQGLQSMVQQIASATEEMSTVSETISSDIEVVASVAKEASRNSAEIETASNGLARLSAELQEITRKFKT